MYRSHSRFDFKIEHNKASPYFDLSPLYGTNEVEIGSIRMKDGRGMLRPDSFHESERLDMFPDSVPTLLVLWNRYHNVYSHHDHAILRLMYNLSSTSQSSCFRTTSIINGRNLPSCRLDNARRKTERYSI